MRSGAAAVMARNRVYLFGGIGTVRTNMLAVFDLDRNRWEEVHCTGKAPPARCLHSMARAGHDLVVFGGACVARRAPA